MEKTVSFCGACAPGYQLSTGTSSDHCHFPTPQSGRTTAYHLRVVGLTPAGWEASPEWSQRLQESSRPGRLAGFARAHKMMRERIAFRTIRRAIRSHPCGATTSWLSRPEQVVHFFRNVLRIPVVSKELLSQRTDDYRIIVDGGIKRRYLQRVRSLARKPAIGEEAVHTRLRILRWVCGVAERVRGMIDLSPHLLPLYVVQGAPMT